MNTIFPEWLYIAALIGGTVLFVYSFLPDKLINRLTSRLRSDHTDEKEILPLRKDRIDHEAGVVWTTDDRGYPIAATDIDKMKNEGKLAPPPSTPLDYKESEKMEGK